MVELLVRLLRIFRNFSSNDQGSTPLKNCWITSFDFTGDQNDVPGGGGAYLGGGVGISPYP